MKIISIFSLKHLFYLHYAVSVLTIVFLEVLQILIKANFNIIFFVHLGSRDLKNRQRYRVIFLDTLIGKLSKMSPSTGDSFWGLKSKSCNKVAYNRCTLFTENVVSLALIESAYDFTLVSIISDVISGFWAHQELANSLCNLG